MYTIGWRMRCYIILLSLVAGPCRTYTSFLKHLSTIMFAKLKHLKEFYSDTSNAQIYEFCFENLHFFRGSMPPGPPSRRPLTPCWVHFYSKRPPSRKILPTPLSTARLTTACTPIVCFLQTKRSEV